MPWRLSLSRKVTRDKPRRRSTGLVSPPLDSAPLARASSLSRSEPHSQRSLSSTPLVGFQAFPLPLELLMHQAALEGTTPPQMTYTGSNFDIVSGATAPWVGSAAAFGYAPRWLLLAW
jgi:hypothetical protein